jgi:uncharacterized BrkB/YihY/UPF0761 family membrane protein
MEEPAATSRSALEPSEQPEPPEPPKDSRLKRSLASAKSRADEVREDLEQRRGDVKVIDLAFRGIEHDIRTGGGILAGAVAFRFFMFVVPYVFVLVFVLGIGADALDEDPIDLARRTGVLGIAASAVDATAHASTWAQVLTLAFATWALVSGARTLIKCLRAVHALIWQVELQKTRHLTLLALLAIVVTTLLAAVVRLVGLIQHESIVLWVVSVVLLVSVPTALWLLVTLRIFPSAPMTTWRDLLPGALFLGAGVQVLHVFTVVWIARSLESKSETYGAMGAALTILLWAYLLGRLVTGSATLSAVIWADKHRRVDVDVAGDEPAG